MSGLIPRSKPRLGVWRACRFAQLRSRRRRTGLASYHVGNVAREARGEERTTHFGFEEVPEASKAGRVGAVFSSVASSYDSMNDFMSLGIHRLWKDSFVRSLDPGSSAPAVLDVATNASSADTPSRDAAKSWNILDVAGGTGDIAFRMLDYAASIHHNHNVHVTVADINADMLSEGKKRAISTSYNTSPNQEATSQLSFLEANAQSLPSSISPNSIDLYTVAFGIRNFTDIPAALTEAYRVLKPGGVFACLEFAPQLSNPVLNSLYKRWSFGAIPLIGQLVAADRDSYQYLVESIERFPSQSRFEAMIGEAGFLVGRPGWQDLSGGIAAIHKGVKPIEQAR